MIITSIMTHSKRKSGEVAFRPLAFLFSSRYASLMVKGGKDADMWLELTWLAAGISDRFLSEISWHNFICQYSTSITQSHVLCRENTTSKREVRMYSSIEAPI